MANFFLSEFSDEIFLSIKKNGHDRRYCDRDG